MFENTIKLECFTVKQTSVAVKWIVSKWFCEVAIWCKLNWQSHLTQGSIHIHVILLPSSQKLVVPELLCDMEHDMEHDR